MLSLLFALLVSAPANAYRPDPRIRQAEAKIRLLKFYNAAKEELARGGHYTTAISHFEDHDQDANGPRRYYMLGIPDACAAGVSPEGNISAFEPTEYSATEKLRLRDYFRKVPASECQPMGFKIYAVGIVSDAGADVWSIDQEKEVVNVQWGIPVPKGFLARILRLLGDVWGSP